MTMQGRTFEDGLGGAITILERGGEDTPMRFRMTMPRGFGPPAPESHPHQKEDFHVLEGTLGLGKIDGHDVRLQAGERFTLEGGVAHLPRNVGEGQLVFEATLTPGLDAADMFAELYTETRCHKGLAQFARVSMVFRRHARAIVFPTPVRAVMTLVAGFARAIGVRPTQTTTSEPATSASDIGQRDKRR